MKQVVLQLFTRLRDFYDWSNLSSSTMLLSVFCMGSCAPLLFSDLVSVLVLMMCVSVSLAWFAWSYFKQGCFYIPLFVLIFFIGMSWSSNQFHAHRDRQIAPEYELQDLIVDGVIEDFPISRGKDVSFTLRVMQSDKNALSVNSLIKLSCYRCPWQMKPGETWRLTVRLKQPHGYASWGAFDYEKYLFRQRIVGKGYVRIKGENRFITSNNSMVSEVRWNIKVKLDQLDRNKSVGFAMIRALAIGDKSSLTKDQREVFKKSGVSHLMAISGLHVGLVFLIVSILFRWLTYPVAQIYQLLPRQHLVLIPALLSAFLYSALAGFAISTQRAFVMLSIYVLCRLIARDVALLKVLLLAMSVILFFDPFSILDIGFWLSCGAVFVIAQLNATKKKLSLLKLQPKLWLWMLPMNAVFFGQVSLISPFINLIAVPVFCLILIPVTLAAVLLLLIGDWLLVGWLLMSLDQVYYFIYQLLSVATDLPFSSWFTLEWVLLHTVLFSVLLLAYYYQSYWRFVVWLVLLVSLFVPVDYFFPQDTQGRKLSISLLDVGQGLSMVIHITPENYTLVYDTGPRYSSGFTLTDVVLLPFLRSNGIKKVDRLIISHADNDHIGGYQALVENITVKDVLTSRLDVLPNATACMAGQRWKVGDAVFEILSPDEKTPQGSNNLSCVLKVNFSQTSVLITGDIEKQVERYLLEQDNSEMVKLKADIMLVPHQGSRTSSTPLFIDEINPKLALVAAGYLNHYGHPHSDIVKRYQEKGIDFVSTVENGSVVIEINRDGWRRQSFRDIERRFWHHQKKPNWD